MGANNHPPEILSFVADRDTVAPLDTVRLYVEFSDEDQHPSTLDVEWSYNGGYLISNTRNQMHWIAPIRLGKIRFVFEVSDPFVTTRDTLYIEVAEAGSFNHAPEIERVWTVKSRMVINDTTQVICSASDPDGDPLFFAWSSSRGRFTGGGSRVMWTAPDTVAVCTLKVDVSDGGLTTRGYTTVNVVPDTTIYFESDFSHDDVTNLWYFEGLLAGLGDIPGTHSVEWDSINQKMSVRFASSFATAGFRYRPNVFGNGTFKITFRATSTQFGMVGFCQNFSANRIIS